MGASQPAIEPAVPQNRWQDLELPNMTPRGVLSHLGPGMILMMTGIGTSHLVTAPTAGGRFEFALLWCIPVAYVFKYCGFEMAFRFSHATGKSLMEAYSTAWKKWPLWYVLVVTVIQSAVGQAGRLIASAAVLYYLFSIAFGWEIPMAVYGFVLGLSAVVIILKGSYRAVEWFTRLFAGILFVTTIAVYFARPAPLSSFEHLFLFETPEGSWLIIAAFLGLLPTGIDVSLQASEWSTAKKAGMGKVRADLEEAGLAHRFDPFEPKREHLSVHTAKLPEKVHEYCARWYRIGLWDFRLGHVASFLIACVFLLLAAMWMYPSEVSGQQVMGEIARMFTDSIGPWMMIVFLGGAFAATYSTAFNYFDGWPRIVGACCRNLFHSTAALPGTAADGLTPAHRKDWRSEYNIYRMTMLFSLVASVAIIAGLPRPVFLVLVASALAFFIAPVIFFLNVYYTLTIIPKGDQPFYPSAATIWFSWASLAVFTAMTVILIFAQVLDVKLFG